MGHGHPSHLMGLWKNWEDSSISFLNAAIEIVLLCFVLSKHAHYILKVFWLWWKNKFCFTWNFVLHLSIICDCRVKLQLKSYIWTIKKITFNFLLYKNLWNHSINMRFWLVGQYRFREPADPRSISLRHVCILCVLSHIFAIEIHYKSLLKFKWLPHVCYFNRSPQFLHKYDGWPCFKFTANSQTH